MFAVASIGILLLSNLFGAPAYATNTSWTWNLTGSKLLNGTGTFTACESTTKTYLTGSYTRPASGFVHMTLTPTSGCQTCSTSTCTSCSNGGGECGGVANDNYAIELPGEHLIVAPILTNPTQETQCSYTIGSLACPASNTFNFIVSQWGTGLSTSSTTQVGVGTFSWTSGTSTLQITGLNDLQDYNSISSGFTLPTGSCSSGSVTATGSGDRAGTFQFNSVGEALYTTAANHRFFALPQKTISSAAQLVGQYAGFFFTADGSGVTPMMNVVVTSGSNNTVSGFRMTTAGALDTSFTRAFTFTIGTQLNHPAAGMIEGSLSDGTSSGHMICNTGIGLGGHNSIFCTGQKPGATGTPANLLLTSVQSNTFTSGSQTAGTSAVSSFTATQGVAQASGPPTQTNASTWVDNSGNFWLFGGYDYNSGGGVWNALWKFDGSQWTWETGADTAFHSAGDGGANYGTRGTAGSSVTPGDRFSGASWTDNSGNLWQLGGVDVGFVSGVLMKFDGTNWTWEAPSTNGLALDGTYGTFQNPGGTTTYPGANNASSFAYDSTNNDFWYFGGYGETTSGLYFKNDLWRYDGTNWTWMAGSSGTTSPATATYGTEGVPSSSNTPGGREYGRGWVDSSGNFWIFGGDQNNPNLHFNDLWKFDGVQWTWVGGASTAGAKGVYGTQGIAASTNWPGSRSDFMTWQDQGGNLWLMGGIGLDSTSSTDVYLNDVWKYDGVYWTWVSGSTVGNQATVYGTSGTPSNTTYPGGRKGASTWVDSTYRVWLYGGYGYDSAGTLGNMTDMWQLSSFSDNITSQITDQVQISGRPYYSFGTGLSHNSNNQYTATLTALQAVSITAVTASTVSAVGTVSFANGSGGGGSYPGGSGGTYCGALPLTLAAGSSCTITVNLKLPSTTGKTVYGVLNVTHTVTASGVSRTATLPLLGAD